MNAPWRCVRGRNLFGNGNLNYLAKNHWLLVDHASHELENAASIFRLDCEEAAKKGDKSVKEVLDATLGHLREAAASVLSAHHRLFARDALTPRAACLVDLRLFLALASGSEKDWRACIEEHKEVTRGFVAGIDVQKSFEALAKDLRTFVALELTRHRRLNDIFLEAQGKKVAAQEGPPPDVAVKVFLDKEKALAEQWLGETIPKDEVNMQILRRWWLCPEYGSEEDEEGLEEGEEEEEGGEEGGEEEEEVEADDADDADDDDDEGFGEQEEEEQWRENGGEEDRGAEAEVEVEGLQRKKTTTSSSSKANSKGRRKSVDDDEKEEKEAPRPQKRRRQSM